LLSIDGKGRMTIECAVTHKQYGTARQVQYKLLKRERESDGGVGMGALYLAAFKWQKIYSDYSKTSILRSHILCFPRFYAFFVQSQSSAQKNSFFFTLSQILCHLAGLH